LLQDLRSCEICEQCKIRSQEVRDAKNFQFRTTVRMYSYKDTNTRADCCSGAIGLAFALYVSSGLVKNFFSISDILCARVCVSGSGERGEAVLGNLKNFLPGTFLMQSFPELSLCDPFPGTFFMQSSIMFLSFLSGTLAIRLPTPQMGSNGSKLVCCSC
jgi:hypothetical protein